jgi:hypothetical protein
MCMRCKVVNRTMQVMHCTTRVENVEEVSVVMDEVEDLVEVVDRSFSTIVDNRDTTCETIRTLLLPVSIATPVIMLLKNVLFYKLSGRKRDHGWEIIMYN